MDSSFLERMNTLLANGEVPGLFEGDEYSALLNLCKEGAQRQGLMLDSNDELYKWFTIQVSTFVRSTTPNTIRLRFKVMRNLHVVFTMNPSANGLRDRASTSPALFNRCVLDWLGDWSLDAYYHVASELTQIVHIQKPEVIFTCGETNARTVLSSIRSTRRRKLSHVSSPVYRSSQHTATSSTMPSSLCINRYTS